MFAFWGDFSVWGLLLGSYFCGRPASTAAPSPPAETADCDAPAEAAVTDAAAEAGITAVIQPGGSMRDEDVIAAADELGLAMVFTGFRHFRH